VTLLCILIIPSLLSTTSFPYTTLFRSSRTIKGSVTKSASVGSGDVVVDVGGEEAEEDDELDEDEEVFVGPLAAYVHNDVAATNRSEEHTSELQSRENLVSRLLLANKNV